MVGMGVRGFSVRAGAGCVGLALLSGCGTAMVSYPDEARVKAERVASVVCGEGNWRLVQEPDKSESFGAALSFRSVYECEGPSRVTSMGEDGNVGALLNEALPGEIDELSVYESGWGAFAKYEVPWWSYVGVNEFESVTSVSVTYTVPDCNVGDVTC